MTLTLRLWPFLAFTYLSLGVLFSENRMRAQPVPVTDHHQHLRDPAYSTPGPHGTITAKDLISMLDEAGVKKAVVLSTAYGPPPGPPETEYERVKAENDWTAKQIASFSDRLIGFCGINPMKPYALAEIDRCSRIPQLRYGLKIHFGNSDTDLDDPDKLRMLKAVFSAADHHGMAIVLHMHPSISHGRPYGAREASIFLRDVLPSAPHSPIQIAHLAGPGGYDDPPSIEALDVLVEALKRHDPRMRNVYFDISAVAGVGDWRPRKEAIAKRIREIGVQKVLWGSDGAFGGGMTPEQALDAYRKLPLTPDEFRSIAQNTAPYER